MSKKAIPVIITAMAICLMSMILTVPSHAETVSGEDGDNLTWEFDAETGVLTISGTGAMEEKSTYKYGWYEYKDDITSVVIEDGVTSIGKNAFYYYTNLTSVDMGGTVTEIGYRAFAYSGLETIDVSESLVSIGERAFSNCTALTEVKLPDSTTSIDVYAFYYCVALESIDLGDGLESLGEHAFECCENLKAITIPGGVTTIEEYTFWNCGALESVEICEGVSTIENHAFFNAGVTEIKFPDSITKIETAAFRNAYNLETVEFGTGLEYIGNGAFWLDYELSTIIFHGNAPELGTEAVDGFYGITPFYGVTADVYYYEDTDGWTEEVLESMTKHVYTTFTYHCLSADGEESIENAEISVESATYTGSAIEPAVTVTIGGVTLTEGTDYTAAYSSNTNAGTGKVTIIGIGNYTGTVTAAFTINAKSISGAAVTLSTTSYTYSGSPNEPNVTVVAAGTTLTKGTDYTVSYSNNTDAGTATATITGKGNYTGTIEKTYKISAQKIISSRTILSEKSYTYNGTARTPSVTVTNTSGKKLTEGTDYSVTYASGRKNAGTYTVTVTGKGNYTGTVEKTFTIKAKSISTAAVTLKAASKTYTGSAVKCGIKSVKLKLNGKTTTLTTSDYAITYSSNTKIGTATVKIKGTGNYSGTVTKTFKIIPKKAVVSSIKSAGSKKVTVKWSKVSGSVTKYQIRYRVKGTSTWKTKTVSSSKLKTTLTGLKSGKTYQVQVRAYKTVSGKKYYGSWSSAKTVKVK